MTSVDSTASETCTECGRPIEGSERWYVSGEGPICVECYITNHCKSFVCKGGEDD